MRRLLLVIALLLLAFVGWVVWARLTSPTVDGIPCNFSEQTTYHVHAHLTIIPAGKKPVYPPANIGIHFDHFCLAWVHTHDGSGIIHIEAPHAFHPTLGNFFDIWGQPLSRTQVWTYAVPAGKQLRVYVGRRVERGNPRAVRLKAHTAVTIEIGPPFVAPPPVNFHGL
jgi:hypothetical protein